jgi:hypothetical protein
MKKKENDSVGPMGGNGRFGSWSNSSKYFVVALT